MKARNLPMRSPRQPVRSPNLPTKPPKVINYITDKPSTQQRKASLYIFSPVFQWRAETGTMSLNGRRSPVFCPDHKIALFTFFWNNKRLLFRQSYAPSLPGGFSLGLPRTILGAGLGRLLQDSKQNQGRIMFAMKQLKPENYQCKQIIQKVCCRSNSECLIFGSAEKKKHVIVVWRSQAGYFRH